MKCPKCGAELSEDTKFCSYCGEKIEQQTVNQAQSTESGGLDKGAKTGKTVKTLKPGASSGKKSIADSLKEKGIEYWNSLSVFGKIVTVAIAVFAVMCLVGFLSGKTFAGILSLVQIVLVIVAILLHKGVIKASYTWAKYAVIAVAVLFSILNVSSYSWSAKKPSSSPSSGMSVQTTPEIPTSSNSSSTEESTVAETNYTIEKGSQYAYMVDEWNVYVATAISDSLVKIECWDKTSSSDRSVDLDHDIGTFKINDSVNGFSWIDAEHTAFYMTIQDKDNSKLKHGQSVTFTINLNDSDTNKGSDYDENIICYSYKNDDWHLYRAIPLTENLIKIEVWSRTSSVDKFLYGYDMCVILPDNKDTDFEWTDDEHTSFTITTKDPDNDYYWKNSAFVAFTAENEDAEYKDVKSFLGSKIAGEGEVAVPAAASSYIYENYQDVQKDLQSVGFTNITTEIKYDIVLGWTDEGEVDSVSIDGKTDFDEGTIFKQDAPVIIAYHMKEEDDPDKEESTSEKISEGQQSEIETEPVQEENLTVDNCPELAAMLSNKAEIDESYSSFATQYNGRIIEFDGRIDYCTKHGNYNTRFDYLVSAGDYDPNHQVGPSFKFEDVNYTDLHTNLDTVSVGLNVHIVAKVISFDSNSGLFYLEPVSITGR